MGGSWEGLGAWGVGTLFFVLSGYLLCDYFWRPQAPGAR